MTNSVDPDQSSRPVYTIKLYRCFFAVLKDVKISYCLRALSSTCVTHTYM